MISVTVVDLNEPPTSITLSGSKTVLADGKPGDVISQNLAHEYCHPNYGYHSCVSSCIIQDHGAYKHQNVRFISVHITFLEKKIYTKDNHLLILIFV
jgi:hypothetical protein